MKEVVEANVSKVLEGLKVASSVSAEVNSLKSDLSDINKRIEDPKVRTFNFAALKFVARV